MAAGSRKCPKCGSDDVYCSSIYMDSTGDYKCADRSCRFHWTTNKDNLRARYEYDA